MFGRKKPSPPEQGREGRQVVRQGSTPSPAFSYYTNRPADAPSERRTERQERGSNPIKEQSRGATPRSWLSTAPFWLLLLVFGVCVVKVLALGTDPKIIVVGKSPTAANYMQPVPVYEAAGKKIFGSSLTNRSKLTVNLDGTAQALQQKFPELQNVSVSIPLVGTRPLVYVQVAQPSLIVTTPYGNYAVNSSGVVLAKLQTIPSGIPIVVDQSGARPKLGTQFLPGSTVAFAQTVVFQFNSAHLPINTFVLQPNAPYELDVRLNGQKYLIRMNIQADARLQSGAAAATLQQLGSAVPNEYLDVRTPDRAYYK
jgi:hypothetical protein